MNKICRKCDKLYADRKDRRFCTVMNVDPIECLSWAVQHGTSKYPLVYLVDKLAKKCPHHKRIMIVTKLGLM